MVSAVEFSEIYFLFFILSEGFPTKEVEAKRGAYGSADRSENEENQKEKPRKQTLELQRQTLEPRPRSYPLPAASMPRILVPEGVLKQVLWYPFKRFQRIASWRGFPASWRLRVWYRPEGIGDIDRPVVAWLYWCLGDSGSAVQRLNRVSP